MTAPPPGSRFADFLEAYGRREHEAYLQLERYQEFVTALLSELREYVGIPEGQLVYVPLDPSSVGERGSFLNAMGYGEDDWFHVTFRILFPSPNTSLPRAIGIRLRVLERDGEWVVKTFADAEPFQIGDNNERSRRRFCDHLIDELIYYFTVERPPHDGGEGSVVIGFRLPPGEG